MIVGLYKKAGNLWSRWSVGDRRDRLASGLLAPPPPLRSAPGCRLPPPQPQWLGQNLASCVSLNLGSRNNAASCVSLPHPLARPRQFCCPYCPDGPPWGSLRGAGRCGSLEGNTSSQVSVQPHNHAGVLSLLYTVETMVRTSQEH